VPHDPSLKRKYLLSVEGSPGSMKLHESLAENFDRLVPAHARLRGAMRILNHLG
jgi:hypothetical protein